MVSLRYSMNTVKPLLVTTYGPFNCSRYKRGGLFIQVKIHGRNHFGTCPCGLGVVFKCDNYVANGFPV